MIIRILFTSAWLAAFCASADVFAQRASFPEGTRVEVDGRWNGEIVEAIKVVVEEPDSLPEIKGNPQSIDVASGIIVIPPFTIEVTDETDIDDDDDPDDSYRLDELKTEWRLKVEGTLVAPLRFRATNIDVDRKAVKPGVIELEGFVSEETFAGGVHRFEILGVSVLVTDETVIPEGVFRKARRRLIDEDDERPADQLVLFGRLTIGGEVQVELEYEDDYDLQKHDNGDIFALDTSANVEALLDLNPNAYIFAKVRTAKKYVIFDEDRDKEFEEETKLEELNLYWENIFDLPVAIMVGRQDFDEEREWLYDENLDAVRFFLRTGSLELEYSFSGFIADAPRPFSDRTNHIFFARWRQDEDSYVGAYVIDIQDDSSADDSPFFVGVRAIGEVNRNILYWLDYAYVDGVNGFLEVEGHGGDAGAAYQFTNLPLGPYVYGSYAFGTGDGRAGGRTDRDFRQTGYQDNNDKFFGVASFRYYGELFRPELSNLHICTVGVGIRPVRWLSCDLLYHRYRQHTRSTTIRDSDLRADPNGLSRDIGEEIDLIVGLDDIFGHMDVEIDVGYFVPGSAFDVNDHPALWCALQLEWNF